MLSALLSQKPNLHRLDSLRVLAASRCTRKSRRPLRLNSSGKLNRQIQQSLQVALQRTNAALESICEQLKNLERSNGEKFAALDKRIGQITRTVGALNEIVIREKYKLEPIEGLTSCEQLASVLVLPSEGAEAALQFSKTLCRELSKPAYLSAYLEAITSRLAKERPPIVDDSRLQGLRTVVERIDRDHPVELSPGDFVNIDSEVCALKLAIEEVNRAHFIVPVMGRLMRHLRYCKTGAQDDLEAFLQEDPNSIAVGLLIAYMTKHNTRRRGAPRLCSSLVMDAEPRVTRNGDKVTVECFAIKSSDADVNKAKDQLWLALETLKAALEIGGRQLQDLSLKGHVLVTRLDTRRKWSSDMQDSNVKYFVKPA